MQFNRKFIVLAGVVLAGWCGGSRIQRAVLAQTAPQEGTPKADKEELQRSAQLHYFKRMGQSGAKRGQEIYLLDCFMCHNEYTVRADFGDSAPFLLLKNLYKFPRLINGKPVNDETVLEQIRDGGPKMPAFRDTLTDRDLADLVSYLREACCWDEEKVPANPRYHPE